MADSWGKPAQTFGVLQKSPNPFQPPKKTPTPPRPTTDGFEILKEMPKSVGKTVQEHAKTGFGQAVENITGIDLSPMLGKKGEMQPGTAIDLASLNKNPGELKGVVPEKKPVHIEAGIETPNYARDLINASKKAEGEERQKMQRSSQEILGEIQRIAATTKDASLQRELIQATGPGMTPDKATSSVLSNLLSLARDVQQRSSESGTWQRAVQGKRNMQGQFGQPQSQKAKSGGMMGRFKPKQRSDIVNSETNAAKSG